MVSNIFPWLQTIIFKVSSVWHHLRIASKNRIGWMQMMFLRDFQSNRQKRFVRTKFTKNRKVFLDDFAIDSPILLLTARGFRRFPQTIAVGESCCCWVFVSCLELSDMTTTSHKPWAIKKKFYLFPEGAPTRRGAGFHQITCHLIRKAFYFVLSSFSFFERHVLVTV